MQVDRPLIGILLMLGFCIVAPMGDATAKLLATTTPLLQVVLLRFLLQAVFLMPVALAARGPAKTIDGKLGVILARTLLHILGIGMMFTALRYLPLADAVAIAFVMPFIMLLLGWFFLGEEVGWRRLLACAVGFIGTLLVMQPSFAEVGWPALLPVGVALNFAVFMLVTRKIAKDIDPVQLQTASGVIATLILLPAVLLLPGDLPGAGWIWPEPQVWGLILLFGVFGTLGHLLMTWSLRFAPSATVAPVQYLEIPFATLIGFLVFGDLPNGLAALGICITIGAGLYILFRERATARQSEALSSPGAAPPAV